MMYPNDRYAALRELLKRQLKGTSDLLSLLREIGYAILFIADELSTLRDIRSTMVLLRKDFLDFQQEALSYRKKRIEKEGGEEAELLNTQDLIDKLNERNRRITVTQAPSITQQLPHPAPEEKKPNWFVEKVLPALVGGVVYAILQALLKLTYGGQP